MDVDSPPLMQPAGMLEHLAVPSNCGTGVRSVRRHGGAMNSEALVPILRDGHVAGVRLGSAASGGCQEACRAPAMSPDTGGHGFSDEPMGRLADVASGLENGLARGGDR
jgi:hypothetical protein